MLESNKERFAFFSPLTRLQTESLNVEMTRREETRYSYEQSYLYISLKSFLYFWLMWITESPSADMTDTIIQLPGREDNFIENWIVWKSRCNAFVEMWRAG